MSIGLIRIDDRLLHGQVAIGWAGTLRSKLIVVANDRAAGDDFLKGLYADAAPEGSDVRIWTLRETADQVEPLEGGPDVAIIVIEDVFDVLELLEMGARFTEVNIGGMHFEEGKRELLPYVYVGERDVAALRRILDLGVALYAQDVPGGKRHDVGPLLERIG